jgi:hypothetical protein
VSDHPSIAAPSLVSLLVCDQVIDDKLSNKKSAIGLFNSVLVPAVPARIHQLAVMATLTEISGRTPLQLRLMRDEDNSILMHTNGHVDAPNPLAMVDLVFAMQGVPIAKAGQYAFELLSQGELLGRRRFQVVVGRPRVPRQHPRPDAGGPNSGPVSDLDPGS